MKVKRKPKPEEIYAITFEELVEYGRQNGANIVNGMPWSFTYCDIPVTHENDDCYIVGSHFYRGDMLVVINGLPIPYKMTEFNQLFEPASRKEPNDTDKR